MPRKSEAEMLKLVGKRIAEEYPEAAKMFPEHVATTLAPGDEVGDAIDPQSAGELRFSFAARAALGSLDQTP